jgi:hypothetical protein
MVKVTKQEVAVPTQSSTQVAIPDHLKGYAGVGMEEFGLDDMEIPRVKLLQAISDEVQERDDCKAGEFFHTIAEMSLGKDLKIVPILIFKSAILWRPRHDGGGILARADDGENWTPPNGEFTVKPIKDNARTVTWKTAPTVRASRLLEWGTYDPENPDSPPAATRMINILAYLPDFPDLSPCVITLQRSAIKIGRKLLSKLKLTQAPVFGCEFFVTSTPDQNASGDKFFNYKFEAAGFVQSEQDFAAYLAMHQRFRTEGVRIKDIDGLQGEDAGFGDDAEPDDDGKHKM